MADTEVEQQAAPAKITLREFIEDYQKTIAVIGVFTALGLIWKTVNPNTGVPWVSYLCFLITIPLFLEIGSGYKRLEASWRLQWFMDILAGIVLLTFFQLIFGYPQHVGKLFTATLLFILSTILFRVQSASEKHTRNQHYSDLTERFAEIAALSISDTEKNVLRTNANAFYRKRRRLRAIFELVVVIWLLLFFLSLGVLLNYYGQAVIDYFRDIQPVEVPPVT